MSLQAAIELKAHMEQQDNKPFSIIVRMDGTYAVRTSESVKPYDVVYVEAV